MFEVLPNSRKIRISLTRGTWCKLLVLLLSAYTADPEKRTWMLKAHDEIKEAIEEHDKKAGETP